LVSAILHAPAKPDAFNAEAYAFNAVYFSLAVSIKQGRDFHHV